MLNDLLAMTKTGQGLNEGIKFRSGSTTKANVLSRGLLYDLACNAALLISAASRNTEMAVGIGATRKRDTNV